MTQLTIVNINNIPTGIQRNIVNIQLNVRRSIFWFQKPAALVITTKSTDARKVMDHVYIAYIALTLIAHWVTKYFQMSPLTNELTQGVHIRWSWVRYMQQERLGTTDIEIVARDALLHCEPWGPLQ